MNALRASHRAFMSFVVVVPLLFALGCSRSPTAPRAFAVRITPPNGASGVSLDASVTMSFSTPVDRRVVEGGMHVIATSDMYAPCPDPSMGSHGTMDQVMMNTDLLRHMDEFHSTHGTYAWNSTGTVCTFTPDSLMRGDMTYMVHLNGSMYSMMQQMGGSMMGGQTNGYGDEMLHFRTMSASVFTGH
jgi:hypothetical protein